MLLKELGSIKMEQKEKVKYFNEIFNHILNKFSDDTKPHDSITIDCYTFTFPTCIAQFFKWAVKQTLTKNYKEAIVIKKDLYTIGVITNDEPTK